MAQMLIVDFKANVEIKDHNEQTALHLAAHKNHEMAARMLIVEGKADLEAKDSSGQTALHLAASNGLEALTRMLIVEGMASKMSKTIMAEQRGTLRLRTAIIPQHP
ncbi:hypothetical protein D8B26_006536 [Coccidioides posadasii str. Silveira]|uniref:uncharacterized protein n=1 Tax=Coccidioides posadasii (strain RMSCC 757 / Silveira) TaxID=443226 RepID=UPI001BEF291D|nr:hypothetical protein D8B26_006536 [Coccidioides posadasii str. Silveira]